VSASSRPDPAPTPPWLEQLSGNRYRFHAAAGGIWRIHDYRTDADHVAGTRTRRVFPNLGSVRAAYRAFVPPKGPKRVYQFKTGESHKPDVFDLERQLRQSEYLGTRHVPDRDPW
jgi:hypothetical protein